MFHIWLVGWLKFIAKCVGEIIMSNF